MRLLTSRTNNHPAEIALHALERGFEGFCDDFGLRLHARSGNSRLEIRNWKLEIRKNPFLPAGGESTLLLENRG
jgi:hypothetical protein